MQTSLSRDCIETAAFFARRAGELEAEAQSKDERRPTVLAEHRAYTLGSVFSSIAFLEAKVNEFFVFANEGIFVRGSGLKTRIARLMGEVWGIEGVERLRTIQKYQLVLTLSGAPKFSIDKAPYQQVFLAIQLRNALMHFRPEWAVVGKEVDQKDLGQLAKRLRGQFPLNPLVGNSQPFFPDRCLSYGCASWCVSNCIAFVEAVLKATGLRSIGLEHGRNRLNIEVKI